MTHSLEPSYPTAESTPRSSWTWRLERTDGSEVAGGTASPSFPSQSDAESWLGEEWRELLDGGVDQVRLLEGEREVYGPMSLHADPA